LSKLVKILFATLFLCLPLRALAQERDLVYTYIGPVIGGGMNKVVYSDWNNLYGKKKFSGYFINSGASIWVVSKWLIGDFSVQYLFNNFGGEGEIHHLYYTISGRIGVNMGNVAIFAPGVGLYFESPPSNRKYLGGAGFRIPVAFLFNTTFDTKLFFDGSVMYGWFGIGDKSTKLFYGINLGFIIKVGRI
jgi:hypothetical protein